MSVSVEVSASKLVSPTRITLFVPLLSPAQLSRVAQLSRALSSVAQLSPAISSVVCIVARLAFDVVVCVGRWLTWYVSWYVSWYYVSWYGMGRGQAHVRCRGLLCRSQALTFDVVGACVGLKLLWHVCPVARVSCGTCG